MKQHLKQLVRGKPLKIDQAADAFEKVMSGQATPPQTAALLALIQLRGPAVSEIVGAAGVMRQKATPVIVPDGRTTVDTCGTGGDGAKTFNISTAAAIVAAAAGKPANMVVAKHGNRAVTSQSGSSQVLEEMGVKLRVSGATLTHCLDQAGLCFCFAPAHHPAMKHAMPIRQDLGFRTIFNILGPLTNPAGADRQVMGVFSADLVEKIAQVLAELGAQRAMVVHGSTDANPEQGLDELTTCGVNKIAHVKDGKISIEQLDPTTLGLPRATLEDLAADGVPQSAAVIRSVLAGQTGPARDITCLNAAAALVVGGAATDLPQGLSQAAHAIDHGAAAAVLQQLVDLTSADPTPRL